MNQELYDIVYKFISHLIEKKDLPSEAAEVISESYIKLTEQGIEITKESLTACCKSLMFKTPQFYVNRGKEFSKQVFKTCPKCNEDVPYGYFGSYFMDAIHYTQSYCRDCAKKYFKAYFEKNRALVLQKNREQRKIERQTLHDNYMKILLRNEGWDTEDITAAVIKDKRRRYLENKERPKKHAA